MFYLFALVGYHRDSFLRTGTEALNQCDTENVAVKVTTYKKDASKDNFSDLLGSETDDFVVLTENDVPGSSLNGKQPHELNVIQLKRWLACRGRSSDKKKIRAY